MLVELEDATVARLKRIAEPLVDSFDSVISRLLDAYDARVGIPQRSAGNGTAERQFSATSPPDLKHTKVLSVRVGGKDLEGTRATWNGLLNACVEQAAAAAKDTADLRTLIAVNFVTREKTDEGYRYLADAKLSIQGQDANSAWRGALHSARALGLPISVTFSWRDRSDAAFPGTTGRIMWEPGSN